MGPLKCSLPDSPYYSLFTAIDYSILSPAAPNTATIRPQKMRRIIGLSIFSMRKGRRDLLACIQMARIMNPGKYVFTQSQNPHFFVICDSYGNHMQFICPNFAPQFARRPSHSPLDRSPHFTPNACAWFPHSTCRAWGEHMGMWCG